MKEFTYLVTDELGIHARPAGLLSKLAKTFPGTTVPVTQAGTMVKATQLMELMNLGVKGGNEGIVAADGPAEDEAIAALEKCFKENL